MSEAEQLTPNRAATLHKVITLTDFIRDVQRKKGASGALSEVLFSIALGTKIVSRGVNRAGLASMLGLTGEKNVQGEKVQKLDVYADTVFSAVLGRSGAFISMVSEEREDMIQATAGDSKSDYVIAFDPLDGSSNIDVNVSIGTIWGVYKRISGGSEVDPGDVSDFLQPGYNQVAAGYTIYGSSTMFVFTTGAGVNGFTFDPTIGEFILTNPDMKLPEDGKIYSCNEGNKKNWSSGVQNYVDQAKEKPLSLRYVGSLVADFHRTMLKGGIFFYPSDTKSPNGKLRLLYECAPMALIAEQAGGRASTGSERILDIVPESIHQRIPLVIGSSNMVDEFEQCIQDSL